jgi:hypothetical protein
MEMSYCYEKGIPHSEFLNWLPEDRAKTIAYQLEQSTRCGMCGTGEWEWEKDRRAYEPVEKFCMGCYLKHMASEEAGQMPGTSIGLEPARGKRSAKRLAKLKREYRGRRD